MARDDFIPRAAQSLADAGVTVVRTVLTRHWAGDLIAQHENHETIGCGKICGRRRIRVPHGLLFLLPEDLTPLPPFPPREGGIARETGCYGSPLPFRGGAGGEV